MPWTDLGGRRRTRRGTPFSEISSTCEFLLSTCFPLSALISSLYASLPLCSYTEARSSWTIWLYKDIGFQGMVHTDPESPYMKLLAPFLAKKKRLAADEWGTDLSTVQHVRNTSTDLSRYARFQSYSKADFLPSITSFFLSHRSSNLSRTGLKRRFLPSSTDTLPCGIPQHTSADWYETSSSARSFTRK